MRGYFEVDPDAEVAVPTGGPTRARYRDRHGHREALGMLAGTMVSMPLMAAVSATIGGADGVVGILGAAVMTGAGVHAVRVMDRERAASAACEVFDRACDRDPGDVFEARWDAA